MFDLIRPLFSQLPESKLRGYTPRRFSFNVPGGRCETCEGNGQLRIEMHFLPDVWVECDTCRGQRYNPETLAVPFHGKLDRRRARHVVRRGGRAVREHPEDPPHRCKRCATWASTTSRSASRAPTLSGGEAQRVKLAAELARPDTGQTLYLLDEPTTGLHFDDLAKLLDVLNRLVDLGNTVVVIEHNLDVIKTADWVIDLGPEAGDDGGHVVAAGTPEHIVEGGTAEGGRRKKRKRRLDLPHSALRIPHFVSHTAAALAPVLAAGPLVERKPYDPAAAAAPRADDLDIDDVGRDTQHALGSRRPPLAHAATASAAPASPAVGRPHPRRDRSAHPRAGRVQRRRIGTTARSSKSPRRRNPTAGSSTRSPASAGC